jgi:hypothetical protein
MGRKAICTTSSTDTSLSDLRQADEGGVMSQVCQELERQAGRAKLVAAEGSVDLEYLKNIMLKLYETGELTVKCRLCMLLSSFEWCI